MLYKEEYRPQYHFSAPRGWLNDPNGCIWYKGEYHIFYQYNPESVFWDAMHWGHAVSRDMIHWENLPVALYPDENGTCFSGCCVIDKHDTTGFFEGGEGMVAIYSGHLDRPGQRCIEHQCLAYSRDCGRTWTKYDGNPVLTAPDTPDAPDFRDPKVFWHEETRKWVMFLGGGFYRVYTSDDLKKWELVSKSRIFEEYPDISRMKVTNTGETKYVLNLAGFKYFIGDFDGKKFIREEGPYTADYADGCQATQTFENMPDGRVAMLTWMRDGSRAPSFPWRNSMAVCRELTLKKLPDGTHRMIQVPVREIESLREKIFEIRDLSVGKGENPLKDIRGRQNEITADITPGKDTKEVVFSFLMNKDEHTDLVFDYENGLLFLDYTAGNSPRWRNLQTSMDQNYFLCPEPIKFKGKCYHAPMLYKDRIKAQILLDQSAVEILLWDGEMSFSFMIYGDADADGMSVTADGSMKINNITVNKMKGIWD